MSSKGFAARAQSAGDRNNTLFNSKQSSTNSAGTYGSSNHNIGSSSGGTKDGQGSNGARK